MHEERRQVRRCLARLTQSRRESIVLAYYRGLRYREIGETPHTAPCPVKSRVRDDLIRLRDRLGVAG